MAVATTVVGGIVGATLIPRMQRLQVRRIKRTLRRNSIEYQDFRPFKIPVMSPLAAALKARFEEAPSAPLIVTGPEGVGKSTLLHHALSTQQNKGALCMYLSLSHEPVRTPDAFVRLFVDRTGFLVSPANTILMRSILRTKPEKARINEEDIEKAFKTIEIALIEERNSKWRRGIPIICIEETHMRGRDMIDTENPLIGRFLEWCCHLASNQLSHVVFVASISAAMRLEKESGLQDVRDLMFVDFPNENRILQVLSQVQHHLTESDREMIVDKIGGDMKDMSKLIYALKRGTPAFLAVEDRIVQALKQVEREITFLLKSIPDAGSDRLPRLEASLRFCRFWKLLEALNQKPKVKHSDLISTLSLIHI